MSRGEGGSDRDHGPRRQLDRFPQSLRKFVRGGFALPVLGVKIGVYLTLVFGATLYQERFGTRESSRVPPRPAAGVKLYDEDRE